MWAGSLQFFSVVQPSHKLLLSPRGTCALQFRSGTGKSDLLLSSPVELFIELVDIKFGRR